ncbi:c-type cytochrome [Dyadobacter flavalbus]|uniref:C-type cytochrome n=3 Tax=Spirosomataceae TaxID=2896860 RepID=A0A5R9KM68_9BACT|nr:c-type cytochrome [Dyadobacter flavalbus]TLU97314.1 c-type cytochrome [Dyadobacter sediminis]
MQRLSYLISFAFLLSYTSFAQVNLMSVAPAEPDNSVESEMASFKIADGYKIELFASETLGIADPCAMRWDEKGRLWVLTIPSYPQPMPGSDPNDKLVILEDKDGDGKADYSSVFAEGLNIPLGFELGHGGVYLGEQTELVFLKDTDNDGKADSRKVLLSGFGTHDSHQTINSFLWSPGGELFFSQGHSIYSRVETAWGIKKADRASIWRYRPLQNRLDGFLDGSTASVNPWGMNFGEWGEMFHKANDPELFYTVPGMVNTTHRALLPPIGELVIKGSIIEIVRTKHLPKDLWGDFVIAGYYNNKVERMRVAEDSSGYRATLLDPILTSSSRSFRPIDIKIGPDGAMYVLDWYNPIIGHYQASMRHPDRDKTHGRIWRITATGRPLLTPPVLTGQSVPTLLDHLKSKEHWVRYQVRKLLAERPFEEVSQPLTDWVAKLSPADADFEHHLLEAIHVYESHEIVNEDLLQRLAKGEEPGARGYAAHVAGRWADRLENPLAILEPLINDPVARVRLEALVAVSDVHRPEAMAVAGQILNLPTDKFIRYALEKTVYALEQEWEPALRKGMLAFKDPAHLAYIVSVIPPTWYTADMYRKLISDELSKEVKRSLLISLAKVGGPSDIEFVLKPANVADDAVLLDHLAKTEPRPVTQVSLNRLKSILEGPDNKEVAKSAVRLIRAWKLKPLAPAIQTLVSNGQKDASLRAEGLQTLAQLNGRGALPILQKLVKNPQTPRQIRLAGLQSLSMLDIGLATQATLNEIGIFGGSVAEFKEILSPVLERKGGIASLTTALATKSLSREKAGLMLEVLAVKGINAAELKTLLNKQAGVKNLVTRNYDQQYVDKLSKQVKEAGDAGKGKAIYMANPSCASCHTINGKGGNIGPNLSAIGKGLSTREIISEVLWPNQNVKEGYNRVAVETKTGELIQGIKIFENAEEIQIETTESRKPKVLSKKIIVSKTETGSLMPSGLVDNYSEEELRDLLRYLSDLGN